jgi:hypothetical protein
VSPTSVPVLAVLIAEVVLLVFDGLALVDGISRAFAPAISTLSSKHYSMDLDIELDACNR